MTKVAYNKEFGGFWLASEALEELAEKLGFDGDLYFALDSIPRHSKILIDVIEKHKRLYPDTYKSICIKEISGDRYIIDEYDGFEIVVEPQDIKWVVVEA